jgi:hypothetical protein
MAWETWRTVKETRCKFLQDQVRLEARLLYAADILPDQPPRVLAYRCSDGQDCDRFNQADCPWGILTPTH